MDNKIFVKKGNKGGFVEGKIWRAARLEGVAKNRAIKPVKKSKRVNTKKV